MRELSMLEHELHYCIIRSMNDDEKFKRSLISGANRELTALLPGLRHAEWNLCIWQYHEDDGMSFNRNSGRIFIHDWDIQTGQIPRGRQLKGHSI
jgi:hypothetical protein